MNAVRRMLTRFRAQTPPIGLELGADSLKMIQLTEAGGRPSVLAAVRVPLPDEVKGDPDRRVAFAAEQLRQVLKRRTFLGNRVVAALPKELLHYKTHRLPPIAPEEVPAAARIDARDLFRFDPNSADVQWLDAGEIEAEGGERRREIVLVAAGKKYIDQFTIALDTAGADMVSLDVDPCALWRAARRVAPPLAHGEVAHPRAVLDVGSVHSRLVIGFGAGIRLIKTIDPTDTPDLLARDVLKCVRYHAVTFQGSSPKCIELVGGWANDPGVRSALASTLQLPANPANLFANIEFTAIAEAERTTSLGEWAVALGLALKGLNGQPVLSVAESGAAVAAGGVA